MWVSRYVCLFIIYSLLGWIYESIYCTVKGGKWENRGFLYGPVCPIYGTGAVIITAVTAALEGRGLGFAPWQIFIVSVLGSAVLEYVTSWALEALFHAVWWDYSHLPFNLNGRISLFTSLGFGLGGLLIVYAIKPAVEWVVAFVPPVGLELASLVLVSVLMVDLTLTVSALKHFDRVVMRAEESFNRNMDTLVEKTFDKAHSIKKGFSERKAGVDAQLGQLSEVMKGAVGRIYSFRDKNKNAESARNALLSAVKRHLRRGGR